MRRSVGVTVHVAIEASDSAVRLRTAAVFRLIELLLGEGCDQKPNAFDLFRVQNPVEELKVVVDGDQPAF
jgi:hypothetical protein